jgi:hypothetical protein
LCSNAYSKDRNKSELQNRAGEDWVAMRVAVTRVEVSYSIQQKDWIAIYIYTYTYIQQR